MDKSRILITGGCGFVGINLCERLLAEGYSDISLLDNGSNSVAENLDIVWGKQANPQARKPTIIDADVRDGERVCAAVRGMDAVVHLAAFTRVVESLQDPAECYAINVQGTINVLEACRKAGVTRFVFASSNAAVGDANTAVHEEIPPHPLSPYGATKLIGEALCSAYAHSYGMQTAALRFANAYGPYCQKKGSVVALFLRTMLAGQPLTIYGDGRQTRDFIHVADICGAIARCLQAMENSSTPQFKGEIFQVATGIETSVLELVSVLTAATGLTPELVYRPPRAGEIIRNCSDITKLRERLGYRPEINLSDGIGGLYRWMKEHQSSGTAG
jgi:UDP-glucose 4-epimerase